MQLQGAVGQNRMPSLLVEAEKYIPDDPIRSGQISWIQARLSPACLDGELPSFGSKPWLIERTKEMRSFVASLLEQMAG